MQVCPQRRLSAVDGDGAVDRRRHLGNASITTQPPPATAGTANGHGPAEASASAAANEGPHSRRSSLAVTPAPSMKGAPLRPVQASESDLRDTSPQPPQQQQRLGALAVHPGRCHQSPSTAAPEDTVPLSEHEKRCSLPRAPSARVPPVVEWSRMPSMQSESPRDTRPLPPKGLSGHDADATGVADADTAGSRRKSGTASSAHSSHEPAGLGGSLRRRSLSLCSISRQAVTFSPEMESLDCPKDLSKSPLLPAILPHPSILQQTPTTRSGNTRGSTGAGGAATAAALSNSFRMNTSGFRKSSCQEEYLEESFTRVSALVTRMSSLRKSGSASELAGQPLQRSDSRTGSCISSGQRYPGLQPTASAGAVRSPTEGNEVGTRNLSFHVVGSRMPTPSEQSFLGNSMQLSIDDRVPLTPPDGHPTMPHPAVPLPPAVDVDPRRISLRVASFTDASSGESTDIPFLPSRHGSAVASDSGARRRHRSDVSFAQDKVT